MKLNFSELNGKTLSKVENKGNEEIIFTTIEGDIYKLYHDQECCESVTVDDICGDLNDLIGSPLMEAEEVTSDMNPEDVKMDYQESFTWTFYKLRTAKGFVTIRWYGKSNGYYSESVDFVQMKAGRKENCYECKYRRDLIGDAHSRCIHPKIIQTDDQIEVLYMVAGKNIQAKKELNIKGNLHGIKNGWFFWPTNFDPVWLENCDGFEQKEG